MHKKGITEEVAKKRSRKTVKHQRGIVGADLATIAARRNQTAAVRTQQRLAAITKAKSEKKEKETKKAKVRVLFSFGFSDSYCIPAPTRIRALRPQGIEAANEGWQGWKMIVTTLILAFEHCNRASDIVVQLHPSVVFIGTFIQSHFRPRIRHDIFVVYQSIPSSWQIVQICRLQDDGFPYKRRQVVIKLKATYKQAWVRN